MEAQTMKVGTVLNVNESGIVMSLRSWEKLLIPINEALAFYNSFGIGLADSEVCDYIVNGHIEKLRVKYRAAIEKKMKKAGLGLSATIEDASRTADIQINQLQSKIDKIYSVKNGLISDQLNYEYLVMAMGVATLSKDGEKQIRDHFTRKIENEKQTEGYSKFEILAEAYSDFRNFWNTHSDRPLEIHQTMIGDQLGNILTEQDGRIVLDFDFLQNIGTSTFSETSERITSLRVDRPQITEADLMKSEETGGDRVGHPDRIIQRKYTIV